MRRGKTSRHAPLWVSPTITNSSETLDSFINGLWNMRIRKQKEKYFSVITTENTVLKAIDSEANLND